jgi:hypothetical protein
MRLSLFILGVFAAIVWIASPALAQSQSDSVYHRQRVRLSSPPSEVGLVIQQDDRMFIFQAWHPAAAEIKAGRSIGDHHEASTAHACCVYSHCLHRKTR